MSGVSVSYDAQDALRRLSAMIAACDSPREAMETIGFDFEQRASMAFQSGRDPWNAAWEPLSPLTLELRRGSSAQPLLDTGRLAGSMTYRADDDQVDIGTNVIYAATHQFGRADNRMFGRGLAPIPARPFLPLRSTGPDLPPAWERSAIEAVQSLIEAARDGV